MKAVFDTNILIDYLNGFDGAREELKQFTLRQISIITFIEVLVGARDPEDEATIRGFLATFEVLDLSSEVARETILLRRDRGLRIPDAIVYATARTQGCLLVTRNTKDFRDAWPDVRIPYWI